MPKKRLLRSAIVAVTATALFTASAVVAAPAFAAKETGLDPGKGLGTGLTILVFVGIPLGVFVLIAGFVYGPAILRRPRYRPGYQEWGYRPLWVGGPDDPEAALTHTSPDQVLDVPGGGAGAGW